jgi:hypothetical protein
MMQYLILYDPIVSILIKTAFNALAAFFAIVDFPLPGNPEKIYKIGFVFSMR